MNKTNSRQKQEVELITTYHFMTVKQLATKLGVSEMTIRRDLQMLMEQGLVHQVYGGVTAIDTTQAEKKYTVAQEQSKNMALKKLISQKALEFINPTDVVFLDSGSTVQALAELIPLDATNTFITPSFNTLEIITKLHNSTIITPGGVFSPKPNVFYTHESSDFFKRYRANICFIGTTGYDLELGLTCGYIEDVPLKHAMIESSRERILLLDSSKYGKVSTCMFAHVEDFSRIITDNGIPQEYKVHIQSKGIELIIV